MIELGPLASQINLGLNAAILVSLALVARQIARTAKEIREDLDAWRRRGDPAPSTYPPPSRRGES